ncbi:hypothetical protein [Salinarimonas sp.]|uniref:hypothetical protein n=1 Tax=Salinarimonas sp. TaxID=2766526 RepID=UPI0032D944C6
MTLRRSSAVLAAPLLAAALLATTLLAASPAAAQGPGPLPLQSPSERMVEDTNRALMLERRLDAIEQRQRFQEGQFRERLNRLEMFPRVIPPPPPIVE